MLPYLVVVVSVVSFEGGTLVREERGGRKRGREEEREGGREGGMSGLQHVHHITQPFFINLYQVNYCNRINTGLYQF